MKLSEATAQYSNPFYPEDDYGLLTKEEFLYVRNPKGKGHEDGVYGSSLETQNRPDYLKQYELDVGKYSDPIKLFVMEFKGGNVIIYTNDDWRNRQPIAVILDGTLYYTLKFKPNWVPYRGVDRYNNHIDLIPTDKKPAKYIDKYIEIIEDIPAKNINNYPNVMQNIKIAGEQMTVRFGGDATYKKDSGRSIIIMNSDNMIVATATNEWGTTLLQVVEEYRGKGIGKIIGRYWYNNNPSFTSGGFSPKGRSNAIRIWEGRVRELLQSGMYTHLVQIGELTKEKVKEIIADLPERQKKPDVVQPHVPELLLFSDNDIMFVLYDKKFYEDQDEKYIYAHAFLRETSGNTFIYTLDYMPQYKKMATYIIFQIAYNQGIRLMVRTPPSDHIDLNGIEGIKVEGDYAWLTQKAIDIIPYAKKEAAYRKQHDQYDEIYNSLLDIANSKW